MYFKLFSKTKQEIRKFCSTRGKKRGEKREVDPATEKRSNFLLPTSKTLAMESDKPCHYESESEYYVSSPYVMSLIDTLSSMHDPTVTIYFLRDHIFSPVNMKNYLAFASQIVCNCWFLDDSEKVHWAPLEHASEENFVELKNVLTNYGLWELYLEYVKDLYLYESSSQEGKTYQRPENILSCVFNALIKKNIIADKTVHIYRPVSTKKPGRSLNAKMRNVNVSSLKKHTAQKSNGTAPTPVSTISSPPPDLSAGLDKSSTESVKIESCTESDNQPDRWCTWVGDTGKQCGSTPHNNTGLCLEHYNQLMFIMDTGKSFAGKKE
jgi:hypothetical protein